MQNVFCGCLSKIIYRELWKEFPQYDILSPVKHETVYVYLLSILFGTKQKKMRRLTGNSSYPFQLWDWGNWVNNIALRQIAFIHKYCEDKEWVKEIYPKLKALTRIMK